MRWVALLRGVNVGGGNRLPMADLRATAESLGWHDPVTYIQSGNLLFTAEGDESALAVALATALVERHRLTVPVVLRPGDDLARVSTAHPRAGGAIDPKLLHVAFLDRAPSADVLADVDPAGYEPDRWALDGREVYLSYPGGSGRSKLTVEVFERAWGVTATGRNLNTVARLAALAGG